MCIMLSMCIVLGVILLSATVKNGNCMYAAIIHGVVNGIGEMPVYFSINLKNELLGPNPTGILTMMPLVILAGICFFEIEKL